MYFLFLLPLLPYVAGHVCPWHPSMWGFNVTSTTFSYDNRPVVPLMNRNFNDWWFHGHLDHPPHPEDVFLLPAGQNVTTQIACNKGATTFYASSEGGNVQDPNAPNDVCPGSPTTQYHTKGIDDVKGCALAIAYKSNVNDVVPEDFTIFSVNQTCVWNRYTDFSVPKRMPSCPNNMCICAFFWIHSPDSGSEQNYMNGFQCSVTNSTSTVGLATPKVARRCGADPANDKLDAALGNCTYGAKQPLYWFQAEKNNMFEGTYSPPFYNDLYNFRDGAQSDIFQDSYSYLPTPGANQTELPVLAAIGSDPAPVLLQAATTLTASTSAPATSTSATSTSTSPSSSPNSQCSRKRSASRRHAHAEGRSLSHKIAGMVRRSRPLDLEKKSDLWNPL